MQLRPGLAGDEADGQQRARFESFDGGPKRRDGSIGLLHSAPSLLWFFLLARANFAAVGERAFTAYRRLFQGHIRDLSRFIRYT
jgi:hypothetical protein